MDIDLKLVISKKKLIGMSWAVLLTTILVYSIATFFFTLVINFEGSDYTSNLDSIEAAAKGYFGGNTPDNPLQYLLIDAHFYFWLAILNNLFNNPTTVLQSLTIAVTFTFVFPTALIARQRNNRILLFVLLLAVFLHPRFIDLVTGNIRSACALAILFWAINLKNSKFKYLLLSIAPTFHLGTLAVLMLYFIHHFWRMMPKFFSQADIKTAAIFFIGGALCFTAKIVFPERGEGAWEGGLAYTIAIVILFFLCLFFRKIFRE